MGGQKPYRISPLPHCQHESEIVKDNSKKIPTLTAFFELFLGDVKVKILLISWHFLMVF